VKTTEDLYSPLTGRVLEVNTPLEDSPEVVNEDPYGDGWMIRVQVSAPDELDQLMTAKEYKEFIAEESD
jgi:glycine cleavage system H protein